MKKRNILVLPVMIMVLSTTTACGNKEITTPSATNTTVESSVSETNVTAESSVAEPEPEKDVSVPSSTKEINVEDTKIYKLGEDINYPQLDGESIPLDYSFLFPTEEYIDRQGNGTIFAISPSFKEFSMKVVATKKDSYSNAIPIFENENGFLYKRVEQEGATYFKETYSLIRDGREALFTLNVSLNVAPGDATDKEKEDFANLIKEYDSALEESLIANLQ